MKEKINVSDYADQITKAVSKGILLNTKDEKFNSMVIGWGMLGRIWNRPSYTVFVRQSRYTKEALDKSGEFTVSVPLDGVDPKIAKVCGSLSGHNIDKVKEAGLTLEEPEVNGVPGIREYPLTIECRVLYQQDQVLADIPEDIQKQMYPQDVDGTAPMENRDIHTMYIGEIVDAYIIK